MISRELMGFIEAQQKRLLKAFPKFEALDKKSQILAKTVKLSEEVGELSQAVLALLEIQRKEKLEHKDAMANLSEEVADVIITTLSLAHECGVPVEEALAAKIEKLCERFK